MYNILLTVLIIIAFLLILVVVAQPSKGNSASNLTGGGDAMFGKKRKARGFEAVLNRFTVILGLAFMVIALLLANLSA
ncbi:preprotein translocase subunit SecG [Aerococcus sp. 1KP-2016]|uniref:preprotein translocase subunit SecG n=1 Tax=Aerococcus sp. 1KP-2016 TaxID=1981982 RepID=UPI000B992BD6|nr:preprotein translocase subunit SecG [Aerococcus sp. 1KP-2016]OYQ68161.1 preprotein translocase subunit SecG [Aerococcus sp. 1KP-2016]OYW72864.1 MAG: preprotein translocase subunit SecG [Aerococcus viridans]